MTCLIGVYYLKANHDAAMLVRSSSSDLIGFVTLSFSIEFHKVSRALDR